MATWKESIEIEMKRHGESIGDIVATTDFDMDKSFYAGYGGSEGEPFTVWTTNRVYFPVVYDGAEWAASVPRHPCDEATDHVGGQ